MNGDQRKGDVRVAAVLAALRNARGGAITVFVLGIVVTALVAFLTHPVYRGRVVMTVVTDQVGGGLGGLLGQVGGLAALAGINLPNGDSGRAEAIALLSSDAFAKGFIEQENLLPILFSSKWDPTTGKWRVGDPDDVPTLGDGVKKFKEKVRRVNVDELTGVVTLTVDWRDRELAAVWANKLIERANSEMRRRAIDEAQKSIKYLESAAQKTDIAELRLAIYRVIEAQVKNIMYANVREEFAFRVIDPAVVPDADKYVWPRRALILALGLVFSAMLAIVWVLAVNLYARLRESYQESLAQF